MEFKSKIYRKNRSWSPCILSYFNNLTKHLKVILKDIQLSPTTSNQPPCLHSIRLKKKNKLIPFHQFKISKENLISHVTCEIVKLNFLIRFRDYKETP